MKKTVGCLVTLSMLIGCSSFAGAAAPISFSDISAHWAADSIKHAIEAGYVDGYEDGTFRPEGQVTRVEFIKMTVTALKLKVASAAAGDAWYIPYANTAVNDGLHQWSDFTSGDWSTPMTRAEMSRLAVRGSGQTNEDDKKWMYLATKAGLINGLDDRGTLGEDESMTRAQAVTIIERILAVKSGKTLESDKYAISEAEILWHKTNILTMLPQYFMRQYLDYPNDKIDTSKFKYVGENGYSEVEKYVVVDLDDPNDPNRKYIPENVRWRYSGYRLNVKGEVGELPTNAYGMFSINHLVVDAEEDSNFFRVCNMNFSIRAYSPELLAAGKPAGLGVLSTYDDVHESYLGNNLFIKKGYNDIRFTTGQFIPKGELVFDGKEYVDIYVHSATELGQKAPITVYNSDVDYSLAKD